MTKKVWTAGNWWLTPVILATWEADIGRIVVGGQPEQIIQETSTIKITRAKWTGGMVPVVECLLCKHEMLSSNPSPTPRPPFPLSIISQSTCFCSLGSKQVPLGSCDAHQQALKLQPLLLHPTGIESKWPWLASHGSRANSWTNYLGWGEGTVKCPLNEWGPIHGCRGERS
jgi:hypothetical protein